MCAQIIAKAKVPIIKFEDVSSGINFDISFDAANGPQAAENVKALIERLPPMRPLILVLKVFLQQRELNEVRKDKKESCSVEGVVHHLHRQAFLGRSSWIAGLILQQRELNEVRIPTERNELTVMEIDLVWECRPCMQIIFIQHPERSPVS